MLNMMEGEGKKKVRSDYVKQTVRPIHKNFTPQNFAQNKQLKQFLKQGFYLLHP